MAYKRSTVGLAMVLPLIATAPHAQGPAMEFSAETVQTSSDERMRMAHMYVGHERVRMEYLVEGQPVAEIVDWGHGRTILLIPQQRAYIESGAAAELNKVQRRAGEDTNPCLGARELHCQHLGQQTLSGITVDKWEMTAQRDGKTERSLHWIDPQRQMPLRQFWPDGSVTELQLRGQPLLNGRQVEHWEQSIVQPDGKTQRTFQWYDPQLQIAIREELTDGSYRELRNIQIAVQPEGLFVIPAGYRRMEIPAQSRSEAIDKTIKAPAQH